MVEAKKGLFFGGEMGFKSLVEKLIIGNTRKHIKCNFEHSSRRVTNYTLSHNIRVATKHKKLFEIKFTFSVHCSVTKKEMK